jgi:glyoxylase-like metal-dependent hydrolase (beta-lactamase superfamily II)
MIKEKTPVKVMASEEAVKLQQKWGELRKNAFEETKKEITAWGGSRFIKVLSQYEHAFRRTRKRLVIDEAISDGETINLEAINLEAIWTPGHSRDHLCLFNRDKHILFSGDHILPNITSHISHHTYNEGDPLGDYLKSLDKVKNLPANTVLPGHERTFHNLLARVSDLEAHHERRCEEILSSLRKGARTVFEVSSIVSWDSQPWEKMSFWTKRMAAAETYAHLVYLKNREIVKEEFCRQVLKYEVIFPGMLASESV